MVRLWFSELNRIFRSIQFTLQKVHNVCNDPAGETQRWIEAQQLSWPIGGCILRCTLAVDAVLTAVCVCLHLCLCAGVLSVCESARTQFAELAPVWQRIHAIVADENVEK